MQLASKNEYFENIIASQKPLANYSKINTSINSKKINLANSSLIVINLIDQLYNNRITNLNNIKQQLHDELINCEAKLWQQSYSPEIIYANRIFLCAFFEEVLKNNKMHPIAKKETINTTINIKTNIHMLANYILEKALQNKNQKELLEVIYPCLSLGYSSLFNHTKNKQDTSKFYQETIYQTLRHYHISSNKKQHSPLLKQNKKNNKNIIIILLICIVLYIYRHSI